MTEQDDPRPALDAAVEALFRVSALLDPLRLRIWDAEGLTVTQLRLLRWVFEEEGLSNADLADRLYVTRPSVSALLERLERGGFLRREVSPSDRRGIRIWLEERGRRAVQSLRQETRDYAAGLIEALDDTKLAEVAGSLEAVAEAGRARRAEDLRKEHGEA
jgi:DNA-binding MarR family transcriptional regulator